MINRIGFKDFSVNPEIIAPKIFGDFDRQINSRGVLVNDEVRGELEDFLKKYIQFLGLTGKKAFFRIDAYFDENRLYILDMNASFVDGWGNAINFTRAIGERVGEVLSGYFPSAFFLQDEVYRPEFELAIREIGQQTGENFSEAKGLNFDLPTYIYGTLKDGDLNENTYPFNGVVNDDKRNLARFSRAWKGDLVKIPDFIIPEESKYSELPEDIVLKIASKNDISIDGRNKVFVGKSTIGKRGRKLWEEGALVAQTLQNPRKNDNGENTQAIILTAGAEVIAGYVQNSAKKIINDSSVQSPLVFK